MPSLDLKRRSALDDLRLVSRTGLVEVSNTSFAGRFVFRGEPEALGTALGAALPTVPCRFSENGDSLALWLGPDEWLLLAPAESAGARKAAMKSALAGQAASLVDVSHRHFGIAVKGTGAADLIACGCPLDLHVAAFPVGMCARTLFAKCEIVLWRMAPDTFCIEAWRSFAPYLIGLLAEAARSLRDQDMSP